MRLLSAMLGSASSLLHSEDFLRAGAGEVSVERQEGGALRVVATPENGFLGRFKALVVRSPARHREAREQFGAALRRDYGDAIASDALKHAALDPCAPQPLSARMVRLAVGFAQDRRQGSLRHNAVLASQFAPSVAVGDEGVAFDALCERMTPPLDPADVGAASRRAMGLLLPAWFHTKSDGGRVWPHGAMAERWSGALLREVLSLGEEGCARLVAAHEETQGALSRWGRSLAQGGEGEFVASLKSAVAALRNLEALQSELGLSVSRRKDASGGAGAQAAWLLFEAAGGVDAERNLHGSGRVEAFLKAVGEAPSGNGDEEAAYAAALLEEVVALSGGPEAAGGAVEAAMREAVVLGYDGVGSGEERDGLRVDALARSLGAARLALARGREGAFEGDGFASRLFAGDGRRQSVAFREIASGLSAALRLAAATPEGRALLTPPSSPFARARPRQSPPPPPLDDLLAHMDALRSTLSATEGLRDEDGGAERLASSAAVSSFLDSAASLFAPSSLALVPVGITVEDGDSAPTLRSDALPQGALQGVREAIGEMTLSRKTQSPWVSGGRTHSAVSDQFGADLHRLNIGVMEEGRRVHFLERRAIGGHGAAWTPEEEQAAVERLRRFSGGDEAAMLALSRLANQSIFNGLAMFMMEQGSLRSEAGGETLDLARNGQEAQLRVTLSRSENGDYLIDAHENVPVRAVTYGALPPLAVAEGSSLTSDVRLRVTSDDVKTGAFRVEDVALRRRLRW